MAPNAVIEYCKILQSESFEQFLQERFGVWGRLPWIITSLGIFSSPEMFIFMISSLLYMIASRYHVRRLIVENVLTQEFPVWRGHC